MLSPDVDRYVELTLRPIVAGARQLLELADAEPELTELADVKRIPYIQKALFRLAFKVPRPQDPPDLRTWSKAEIVFACRAGTRQLEMHTKGPVGGPDDYSHKRSFSMDDVVDHEIRSAVEEVVKSFGVQGFNNFS
ncbi:hypothetical protein WMF38_05050 [Sorangium sp. So ce118]